MQAPLDDLDWKTHIHKWLAETTFCPSNSDSDRPLSGPSHHIVPKVPSDMVTPPPSTPPSRMRSGSPRKRPRRDLQGEKDMEENNDERLTAYEEDPEKTPSASSSSVLSLGPRELALRSFPLMQSPPSISRSTTTQTSSAKKSTRRPASPVKTFTLQMLQKPVEFVKLADSPHEQLPLDVRQLYQDISDLAVDREGFIPRRFEAAVWKRIPRAKARYFSDQDQHLDSTPPSGELETLLEIESDAELCLSSNASEAAWNIDVHAPLLKLALKPFEESLRRHILTSSRISPAFSPPMQEGSCYDVAGSKLVDFGIALHPERGGLLDNAIHRALAHLPAHWHHLNQTPYDPIRFGANAISIETKTGTNGLHEARLQIGIWVAAWHNRMKILLQQDTDQEDTESEPNRAANTRGNGKSDLLVTLPVIIVVEHDWKLFFACDRGNQIDIIGHINIGDTKSLAGLFIIVAVVRRLSTWIEKDFSPWLYQALTNSLNRQTNVSPGNISGL
ncbi:hypothetical protein EDB81DRAFT_735162 [Dactylonectria macrodidyma]|uniref:PD-(D/E)XK nuclease-like domain-containing protein n=1 Tax=Dactylonectria macrodidyma TaxID=307937 RepID=A0A9P9D4Z3_9HYPO|nr:hypothetical protein EDB81DRAFT_735162 [Dactylonectria macrodidyma]